MVSQFATLYCIEQFSQDPVVTSTFDSAEVALKAFKGYASEGAALPDLIFLDLGLDTMSGWKFIDKLQKLLGNKGMPKIYILSAFGKAKDRVLAQNHPLVFDYIDKPLTRNRLEKIFREKQAS